jgi:hypothetical protein
MAPVEIVAAPSATAAASANIVLRIEVSPLVAIEPPMPSQRRSVAMVAAVLLYCGHTTK